MKCGSAIDRHVGARLCALREARKIDREKLGNLLGISAARIQAYEAGSERLDAERLLTTCRLLNAPVTAFFEGLLQP